MKLEQLTANRKIRDLKNHCAVIRRSFITHKKAQFPHYTCFLRSKIVLLKTPSVSLTTTSIQKKNNRIEKILSRFGH